jgi:hypothetical protein
MPDPGYPQQYSASCIKAGRGPGQIGRAEYDDCHKAAGSIGWWLPGRLSVPGSAVPAVDEIPEKKYLLHMPTKTFPQVSGTSSSKVF